MPPPPPPLQWRGQLTRSPQSVWLDAAAAPLAQVASEQTKGRTDGRASEREKNLGQLKTRFAFRRHLLRIDDGSGAERAKGQPVRDGLANAARTNEDGRFRQQQHFLLGAAKIESSFAAKRSSLGRLAASLSTRDSPEILIWLRSFSPPLLTIDKFYCNYCCCCEKTRIWLRIGRRKNKPNSFLLGKSPTEDLLSRNFLVLLPTPPPPPKVSGCDRRAATGQTDF